MGWKLTTEEKYWEMLGVLPPAVMTSLGFMVGEPFDHSPEGYPRFEAFAEVDGRFYVHTTPLRISEFRNMTKYDVIGKPSVPEVSRASHYS